MEDPAIEEPIACKTSDKEDASICQSSPASTTTCEPLGSPDSNPAHKRKLPENEDEPEEKRSKIDVLVGPPLKIYLDAEFVMQKTANGSTPESSSTPGRISQISWKHSETGETSFVPVLKYQESISEEYLAWLKIRKNPDPKNEVKFQYVHKDGSVSNCRNSPSSAVGTFLKFLRKVKYENRGREIIIVMYSETVSRELFNRLQNCGSHARLGVHLKHYPVVWYEAFAGGNSQSKRPTPIHILAKEQSIPENCQETVEILEKLVKNMDNEEEFLNTKISIETLLEKKDYIPLQGKDGFWKLSSVHPGEDHANMVSFDQVIPLPPKKKKRAKKPKQPQDTVPLAIIAVKQEPVINPDKLKETVPSAINAVKKEQVINPDKLKQSVPVAINADKQGLVRNPEKVKESTPVAIGVDRQGPVKTPEKSKEPASVIIDPELDGEKLTSAEVIGTGETVNLTGIFNVFTNPILLRINIDHKDINYVWITSPQHMGLRYPSKLYRKDGEAYAIFFSYKMSFKKRFGTTNTSLHDTIPEKQSLGKIIATDQIIEDSRSFPKFVNVDLVFAKNPKLSKEDTRDATFMLTENVPAAVLVELKLQNGAEESELKFKFTDLFLFMSAKDSDLQVVTHLFSPEEKGCLAKVVFRSHKPLLMTSGDVLGTALLFQEEHLPLLLIKAGQHAQVVMSLIEEEQKTKTIPLGKTFVILLEKTYVFTKIRNIVCVQLMDYMDTIRRSCKKFHQVKATITQEVAGELEPDKEAQKVITDPQVCDVYWVDDVPYIFLRISLQKERKHWNMVERQCIDEMKKIATYKPLLHTKKLSSVPAIEMNACVMHMPKHGDRTFKTVTTEPTKMSAYLKFGDSTNDDFWKKSIYSQIFRVKKVCTPKLKILNTVFMPTPRKKQKRAIKTQQNYVQAEFVVASEGEVINLHSDQVFAEVASLGCSFGSEDPLEGFKSCGMSWSKEEQTPLMDE